MPQHNRAPVSMCTAIVGVLFPPSTFQSQAGAFSRRQNSLQWSWEQGNKCYYCSVQAALLQHPPLLPESAMLEVVALSNQTSQAEKFFETPTRTKPKGSRACERWS